MNDLAEFLRARIAEDYERKSAGQSLGSAAEVGERLQANVRRHSIGFAMTAGGGTAGYVKAEAAKYADHPDYRPEWQPDTPEDRR